MDIKGKRFLVIGGAGLIGSHTIDKLLNEDVNEIIIYDNIEKIKCHNMSLCVLIELCVFSLCMIIFFVFFSFGIVTVC